MKKLLLILPVIILAIILFSCQEKGNQVVIKGYLEGVEDSTVIELCYDNEGEIQAFRSDTVINGIFEIAFTDSISEPKQMMITAQGEGFPPTWLNIWVEPGATVKITGKDKLLRTWDVQSKVKEQQTANKYIALTKHYLNQNQVVMRDAYALFSKIDKGEITRQLGLRNIDSLYKQSDSLSFLILKDELKLMKDTPDPDQVYMERLKEHSMTLRYREKYPCAECLPPLYDKLSEEQKNSKIGKSIYTNLNPPKVVTDGDDMADGDLFDLDNNIHHLAEYKGKYILLDFWSSGCGPCMNAIPEMREISEENKEKLTLISISTDSKNIWISTSTRENITWTNLNDFKGNEGIWMNYGVKSIPHYTMISPEGKIIKSWVGYGKGSLKSKVREFVK